MKLSVFLLSLLFFLTSGPAVITSAGAALVPGDIAVVVNTGSEDSVRLGRLYIKLRGIPAAHLIEVTAPVQDHISREKYNSLIAGPVKKAVEALMHKGDAIRCLVTVYGVPLKINPVRPPGVTEKDIKSVKDIILQKREELSLLKDDKNREDRENRDRLRKEIRDLNVKLQRLNGNATSAAVDSELALLLYPPYDLAGWIHNPEFIYNWQRMNDLPAQVLMVSRLDAPSPSIVEGMIKTAIDIEKTGLAGKLYLDARGLTSDNTYGQFDREIRKTAEILQKGSMPVVLDNRPELFGPGDAPSAALYCGWYSLADYRDAFEWSRGSVGYHVASSEARSLHDPEKKYWVKSMLERGVIASLGPVEEPYLDAFPPPSVFFQILMSGKYSLAEVFAMSNPFLSWRMILVGDPLYNPFRTNPPYPLRDAPPPPE